MNDKNTTFSKMAHDVDQALQYMRDCEQDVKDAQRELNHRKVDLDNAQIAFAKARDALFREYPELAPAVGSDSAAGKNPPATPTPAPAEPVMPVGPGGPVEFRELDDMPPGAE